MDLILILKPLAYRISYIDIYWSYLSLKYHPSVRFSISSRENLRFLINRPPPVSVPWSRESVALERQQNLLSRPHFWKDGSRIHPHPQPRSARHIISSNLVARNDLCEPICCWVGPFRTRKLYKGEPNLIAAPPHSPATLAFSTNYNKLASLIYDGIKSDYLSQSAN